MSRQDSRHQQAFTTRWRGRDVTLTQIAAESGQPLQRISARYRAGKRGEELTAQRERRGRPEFPYQHEHGDCSAGG